MVSTAEDVEISEATRPRERRRPGRRDDVSPELIPLLRGEVVDGLVEPGIHPEFPLFDDDEDPIRAARGVLVGFVGGMAFWAIIIGVLALVAQI